jgi:hypothetical protein
VNSKVRGAGTSRSAFCLTPSTLRRAGSPGAVDRPSDGDDIRTSAATVRRTRQLSLRNRRRRLADGPTCPLLVSVSQNRSPLTRCPGPREIDPWGTTTYETERTSFEETDQRARRPLSGRQLLDMFAARAPANVDRSHSKCMQLSKPAEMEHLSAHAVIDASGTWSGPNPLGGGAPNLYYTVPVPPPRSWTRGNSPMRHANTHGAPNLCAWTSRHGGAQ